MIHVSLRKKVGVLSRKKVVFYHAKKLVFHHAKELAFYHTKVGVLSHKKLELYHTKSWCFITHTSCLSGAAEQNNENSTLKKTHFIAEINKEKPSRAPPTSLEHRTACMNGSCRQSQDWERLFPQLCRCCKRPARCCLAASERWARLSVCRLRRQPWFSRSVKSGKFWLITLNATTTIPSIVRST